MINWTNLVFINNHKARKIQSVLQTNLKDLFSDKKSNEYTFIWNKLNTWEVLAVIAYGHVLEWKNFCKNYFSQYQAHNTSVKSPERQRYAELIENGPNFRRKNKKDKIKVFSKYGNFNLILLINTFAFVHI